MGLQASERLRYSILDPTGNITALVESVVEVGQQPSVAASLMERHPEVEQVGFVTFPEPNEKRGVQARLRMAGGEFCGNATMSAAALWAVRQGVAEFPFDVTLGVSGASRPVRVSLIRGKDGFFDAAVCMPKAAGVDMVQLCLDGSCHAVPVVRMEGISHAVVDESSPLFFLRDDHAAAERAIRTWCLELGADGLGLMFLCKGADERDLVPLVFVPGGDTVFWESSCASGSAAVGMLLAKRRGAPISLGLREPGGTLHVTSDPSGETWLHGSVCMVGEFSLPVTGV